MIVEKLSNGAIKVSHLNDLGYLNHCTYFGYSEKEAVSKYEHEFGL